MNQKKCPHCGEYVQRNSLTCPKCFKEIPREMPAEKRAGANGNDKRNRHGKVPPAAVFLSVFPVFVGLLGLGMIYLSPKDRKGYWFLVAGLLLFLPFLALFFMMLNSGFFSAVLLFIALMILLLIYVSAAISAFIETVFGSVLKILRF